MVDARDIIALSDAIARQFSPQRIVLFGSYARGDASVDSDVDLLVIMPHRRPSHHQATRIRLATDVKFPLDLIVRRPQDIPRRIAQNDFFLREVMEKGIVLYAADDPRMGEQGRRRLRRGIAAAAVA
ncbi:MAG: nucleotidyltransferase domain-containing protein [Tepidisphaeraceae bacterium]